VAVVAHRVFAFWIPIVPGCVFAFSLPRAAALARLPDPDASELTLPFDDHTAPARLASGERG
jgi:hypothetical protein